MSTMTTSRAARLGGCDRVEGDGGRVGTALGADEVCMSAAGPDLELLLGRGAERVRRREDDRAAGLVEPARELPDRRRLAGAVHADDEDYGRAGIEREPRFGLRGGEVGDDLLEACEQVGLGRGPPLLQSPHDLDRGRDAHVGRDQRLLDPLPGFVVRGIERRGKLARECAPARAERVAQAPEPAAPGLLRLVRSRAVRVPEEVGPGPRHAAAARSGASRFDTTCETPSAPIVTP